MTRKRRQHSEQFKFKVALEAAKGLRTINELASAYNLHPNQVSNWKKQLLEAGPGVFPASRAGHSKNRRGVKPRSMSRSGDKRWNWSG